MAVAWLNRPTIPIDEAVPVAVGICVTGPEQLHAALLYRAEDESLRALHFCWHRAWRDEPAPPGYYWVRPGIQNSIARSLAALCRMVASQRALDDVPFGFRQDPRTAFDVTTGKLIAPDGQGFTCATFVLAMFASLGPGVRLVDARTWPHRPCDRGWFRRVIQLLASSGDPDRVTQAQRLRGETDSVRYRPEEVVAAAARQRRPVPFKTAIEGGRRALKELSALDGACWFDEPPGNQPPKKLPTVRRPRHK